MRKRTIAAVLVGVVVMTVGGSAEAAPVIIGDREDARCREALAMADSAFNSTSSSLIWPIAQSSNSRYKIILKQSDADISGGWAIDADPAAFQMFRAIEQQALPRPIYWRTQASVGKRLVIVDSHGGWRGDTYTVFLVNSGASFNQVARQLIATDEETAAVSKPELGDRRWNIPIVLTDASSATDWLIDRGEPYEILADWRVHVVTEQGLATPCRISFGYDEKVGVAGMPAAVRSFAAALDETLGPGNDEGTLQPTARIRLGVERGWANAALRPWALSDTPYNSREEVERGLAAWAQGKRQRLVVQRRIMTTYGRAERALASYYESRHKMGPGAARGLSSRNIDHMLRSYFVFPKSH